MRVIKLSSDDRDMETLEMVDVFFHETLKRPERQGRFFFPDRKIRENGIRPGERLLFTYESQCVYEARSDSGRIKNEGRAGDDYPFYFCVKVDSIASLSGSLEAFEQKLIQLGLHGSKSIAHSQAWSIIDETEAFQSNIDSIFNEMRQENQR